ncbi:MAG: hypothetical protein ACT4PV_15155 [Planctomycetaceae bacterium]
MSDLVGKNMIVRIDKPYPQARNHVYTGKVLDCGPQFLAIDGCVFHFGRPSAEDPAGGLASSRRAVRWIPIPRIQFMREMPQGADPYSTKNFRLTASGELSALDRPDLMPD